MTTLKEAISQLDLAECEGLALLKRVLGNLEKEPENVKFRSINPQNQKIALLLAVPGARDLLGVVGFAEDRASGLLVAPDADARGAGARAALALHGIQARESGKSLAGGGQGPAESAEAARIREQLEADKRERASRPAIDKPAHARSLPSAAASSTTRAGGAGGGAVRELTSASDFDKLVSSEKRTVFVDFSATWCGPCKMIGPVFEELAAKNPAGCFVKVDVDELEETARKCGISAMPTFQAFKAGKKVAEMKGADPAGLERFIAQNI